MGQLMAFEHRGFWQPMDTLRDKNLLEELWASGKAPWKVVVKPPPPRSGQVSGAASASSSPATPASRAAGWRCGCSGAARRSRAWRCRRPPTPSLFDAAGVGAGMTQPSRRHPRCRPSLARIVSARPPEIVFHLAAQPLVRASYRDPLETFVDQRHGHGSRAGGAARASTACASS